MATIDSPFATADDLEARWRTLTTAEKALADVLLEDASSLVVDTCSTANDLPDDDEVALAARTATLKRVVCAMVKRAMINADTAGVKTTQEAAGPFSGSTTYANPTGDLYLTKAEKQALPCGGQVAFTVPMSPPCDPVLPW